MMTRELLPLTPPPENYESAEPYLVSFEWLAIEQISGWTAASLAEAMSIWCHPSAPWDGHLCPDRRVVVDVRGVTVLGWVARPFEDGCAVMSSDVIRWFDERGALPIGDAPFLERVNLEALWMRS